MLKLNSDDEGDDDVIRDKLHYQEPQQKISTSRKLSGLPAFGLWTVMWSDVIDRLSQVIGRNVIEN